MKKIISVIASITIIFSLASCKTENELSSSLESDITSSDLTTSNIETTSSDKNDISSVTENSQEPPTVSKDESVSSESSKITQSSNPSPNTSSSITSKPEKPKLPDFEAEKSRAPSDDFATAFDGEYIYYESAEYSMSCFSISLCRNKLDGSSEEVVLPDYCPITFRAINGKLYFLRDGYIYKCNGDGSNLERITIIDNIKDFEIAGDWIFAIGESGKGNEYSGALELYMLKSDYSDLRKISPSVTEYDTLLCYFCGFNRGYLYYKYECRDFISPHHYFSKYYKYRIDYRSNNPQFEELDSKFEFSTVKYYDKIVPKAPSGYKILYDLKDCSVYMPEETPKDRQQFMFVDMKGNTKEVIIPFPENHSDDLTYGPSDYDPNSNYVTAYYFDYKLKHRILYLISPEGIVSELYNKKF